MDAITFIKRFNRMCSWNGYCDECELGGRCITCFANAEGVNAEEIVAIVEKWSKEHPRKTFLSDLLEKYPNVKMDGGFPTICPYALGYESKFRCGQVKCDECWNQELEE